MTNAFDTLLEVQAHDTRIDQILRRMEVLPAREERNVARSALDEVEATIVEQEARRNELAKAMRKLDDEIASIGAKRLEAEGRLYGGSVTNARELQDLQEESEALARRITHLEDQNLALMEQHEPVEQLLAELTDRREQRDAALNDAELRLTASEAELAVELEAEQAARDAVAASVPAELMAEYQSLRGGRGGIGVARLVGNQCGGCHLTLSAMEVASLRKNTDQVAHCEECGRLLVL
ncbi:MAG: C4-type zinc ribbon domain-containing protein [Aquihabitans sp.]